jgi:hypothetical protein
VGWPGCRRAVAAAITVVTMGGCGAATTVPTPVQDHVHAAVPGAGPGEILLGTHYGLRISDDGGRTWPRAGDLARAQLRLLVATGTGFVAVTARDDGATWQPVLPTPLTINDLAAGVGGPEGFAYASSAGLLLARGPQLTPLFDAPVLSGDVLSVRRWYACPACLVVATDGAVATSADGGLHWTQRPTAIPFATVESWSAGGSTLLGLAPAPASPRHGLYRSTDGGTTWTRVIDAPLVDHLLLDTPPGAPLLAFRWGISVYRSGDGGATWMAAGPLRP